MKSEFNHLEAIESILNKLYSCGLNYDAKYLKNEVRSSATGGELCSRVGSTLLAMQDKKEIREAIGPLVDQFVHFCYSIGLLVKPSPFYSPQQKEFIINGNDFTDLKGFYNTIGSLLTQNNQWGKNWNALNDILSGGFFKTEYGEPFKLVWKNAELSKTRLKQDYTDIVALIKQQDHIEFKEE